MNGYPELIHFEEQDVIIAKDQPQYRPLPAYRYKEDPQGRIVFCWKFSIKDRIILLLSGKLWHSVLTFNKPLQPQLIQLDKPEMPK